MGVRIQKWGVQEILQKYQNQQGQSHKDRFKPGMGDTGGFAVEEEPTMPRRNGKISCTQDQEENERSQA